MAARPHLYYEIWIDIMLTRYSKGSSVALSTKPILIPQYISDLTKLTQNTRKHHSDLLSQSLSAS